LNKKNGYLSCALRRTKTVNSKFFSNEVEQKLQTINNLEIYSKLSIIIFFYKTKINLNDRKCHLRFLLLSNTVASNKQPANNFSNQENKEKKLKLKLFFLPNFAWKHSFMIIIPYFDHFFMSNLIWLIY
jgi:hypothetical protein